MENQEFVRKNFREYYSTTWIQAPSRIGMREWGIGEWHKKIYARHLSFTSDKELNAYLRTNTPFFISYSVAYYDFPTARPMENKRWLGADLVFDLDADNIVKCGTHPAGWVCEKCLDAVKEETIKLVEEFLVPDFGFSHDEIALNFSGNRGYHVHVRSENVWQLGAAERGEISDYMTGVGIELFQGLFTIKEGGRFNIGIGPKPDEGGWRGKIARKFIEALEKETLHEYGISDREAVGYYRKKEALIRAIKNGKWEELDRIKEGEGLEDRKQPRVLKKFIENVSVRLGDDVDRNVTRDVTKLIRLPDSLHGDTGLVAKSLKFGELGRFDPMKDALAFGNRQVSLVVESTPEFVLGGETFGPYENVRADLPLYAAVYLICKGTASILKTNEK